MQTFIALGSGGLTGVGFGMSRQKAYYLPNAHTDSILAIIGEELGLIGTLAVIVLLMVIGWRGLRIALRAPDPFGRLLALGLTAKILWQAIINIGAVTSSLPYTGVTLPFVSFGGNSLCMTMIGIGLMLSVSRFALTAPTAARLNRPPPADPPRPIEKHPRAERRPADGRKPCPRLTMLPAADLLVAVDATAPGRRRRRGDAQPGLAAPGARQGRQRLGQRLAGRPRRPRRSGRPRHATATTPQRRRRRPRRRLGGRASRQPGAGRGPPSAASRS